MQIYLLRHAIAEDFRPGLADADRAITSEGARKLRELLRRAFGGGLDPVRILSSPFKRAQETAEIAAKVLEHEGEILTTKTLIPSAVARETWEEIRLYKGDASLLLVGHEPAMGLLAGYLLGVPELQVDFKKGTIVRVDVPSLGVRPRGVLKWMLAPKLAE